MIGRRIRWRVRAWWAGMLILIGFGLIALSADVLRDLGFIEDFGRAHPGSSYAAPFTCATDSPQGSPQYCFIFGADKLGRDLFSRVIYGARVSLSVALVGSLTSLLIGTIYGVIAGYVGGRVDAIMMRFIDFILSLPSLVLIILLQVFFGALEDYQDTLSGAGAGAVRAILSLNRSMGGLLFVYGVIALLSWVGVARLARASVLALREREYVEAARAIGASHRRIIFAHLLPNLIGQLVAAEMLAIPAYIFTEASLSFLGLGVKQPVPSWGEMIIRAQREGFVARPLLVIAPAGALALLSIGFMLVGDELANRLDPRRLNRG